MAAILLHDKAMPYIQTGIRLTVGAGGKARALRSLAMKHETQI